MQNSVLNFAIAIVVIGLGFYAVMEIWLHLRRKAGKTCDRCDHEVDLGKGDIMCGASMGLEPLPYGNTCRRFRKKLE